MSKSRQVFFIAMLLTGNAAMMSVAHADDRAVDNKAEALTQPKQQTDASSMELKEFNADFHTFKPGDVVPDLYRSKPYAINQWSQRHLPSPDADSHWTYMGGNYVLITNAAGKILRAMSGDIFYHR